MLSLVGDCCEFPNGRKAVKVQLSENYISRREELAHWKLDRPTHYLVLDSAKGFQVRRIGSLAYEVDLDGKRVRFLLNDRGDVAPPTGGMSAGEIYLGPVFDDSGLRVFLIYSPQSRTFL